MDRDGKQVCEGNGRVCDACRVPALHSNHANVHDVDGHLMCPATGRQCVHCNLYVCTAKCNAKHTLAATCGHGALCIRSVCAACTKCSACSTALTIDLCDPCRDAITKNNEQHLKVKHQLVPGQGARVRRQLSITGSIQSKDVGSRKTPPPSLSSLEVGNDIQEMKQFDRGHLVALELTGFDNRKNIVPMNYRFNRSGYWRMMEITIGKLMGNTDAVSVTNTPVRANPAVASLVGLTLRSKNRLHTTWEIEIQLFYDDVRGDPRVPVWFYVRVFRNQSLITHFSMGNRCDKPGTMPHDDEVAEFEAAAAIFRGLNALKLKHIKLGAWFDRDDKLFDTLLPADLSTIEPRGYNKGSELKTLRKLHNDLTRFVVGVPRPPMPPNQLLQFMWDVNQAAQHQGVGLVFQTMELGAQKESTPYDSFQREYMRAFNRWKNAGLLISDASTPDLYEGESVDIWRNLSECGGREAPEVDHIDPSYQSGENSYINGRLVSFQHNHMYREKKTTGATALDVLLLRAYANAEVAFTNQKSAKYQLRGISHVVEGRFVPGTVKVYIPVKDDLLALVPATKLTALFQDTAITQGAPNYLLAADDSAWPLHSPQRALVQERQAFLKAAYETTQKQAKEAALDHDYKRAHLRHQAALQHFIDSDYTAHAGRDALRTLINGAGMPLCKPSDVLRDTGGLVNPAVVEVMPVIPDATVTAEYQAAEKAFDELKKKLRF
jgi:hypothetical protein